MSSWNCSPAPKPSESKLPNIYEHEYSKSLKTESVSLVDNSMHEALDDLWKKYNVKSSDLPEELMEILERGMVWAENDCQSTEILITGINPSFRIGSIKESFGFRYRKVQHDPYYAEIKKKLLGDNLNDKAGYLDLFAVRETVQNRMSKFIKHPAGLSFVAEHLAITQKEIERLHPRLIIVKNKGSWMFWGVNAEPHGEELANVWMGYKFEKVPGYEDKPHLRIRRITGLLEAPDRIGKEIYETCLVGTVVLFTSHLQYLKKEDRPSIEMVTQLFSTISSI